MGIFDGLQNPAAPGQAFMAGMERGRAQREERELKGALAAYAVNPDDPAAFETLARVKPEFAIQIRQDRTKRDQAAQVADLQRRAAAGDRSALAQLAGIDLDAYDKLADNDRNATKERVDAIGQAALRISQLPPDQRPAAWDASVGQLATRWPELAEYQGKYSEEALNSAIDTAGQVGKFFELSRPEAFNIGPGEGRYERNRNTGEITTVVTPNLGGAPAFTPAPKATRQVGGKIYIQDENGDWYEGDAGSNASGGFR